MKTLNRVFLGLSLVSSSVSLFGQDFDDTAIDILIEPVDPTEEEISHWEEFEAMIANVDVKYRSYFEKPQVFAISKTKYIVGIEKVELGSRTCVFAVNVPSYIPMGDTVEGPFQSIYHCDDINKIHANSIVTMRIRPEVGGGTLPGIDIGNLDTENQTAEWDRETLERPTELHINMTYLPLRKF